MSFRDHVVYLWSRILAWLTLRRPCALCGYGIWWPNGHGRGERADVPVHHHGEWAHPSCIDYGD